MSPGDTDSPGRQVNLDNMGANMGIYRKAIVLRTNPAHVAKFGAPAFDGLFRKNQTSDKEIVSYFSQKMADEGYKPGDYSIHLSTGYICMTSGVFVEVA